MKKKLVVPIIAALLVVSLAACGNRNSGEEEIKVSITETETTESEPAATEETADLYVEGTVTYADGSTITVEDSSGKGYNFSILDAETDLDDNGLVDGIVVAVTAYSTADEDGNYKATMIKEISDPTATQSSDDSSSSSSSSSSDSSSSSSSSSSSGSSSSDDLVVSGTVSYTDGSIMVVDTDDGDEYTFEILNASVEVDDNGLFEGITVTVTADPSQNDDGNYEAYDVQEDYDPD